MNLNPSNTTQEENWKPLWDTDVAKLINQTIEMKSGASAISSNTALVQLYLQHNQVFESEARASSAKDQIYEFNQETHMALQNGEQPKHPYLTEEESATLMRLGIFSTNEAFSLLGPAFCGKWVPYQDLLDEVLQKCARYAMFGVDEQDAYVGMNDFY